ncbi:MAG: CRISPR-associated protein Cas4 [Clostridia bacterium]|nr:CRISPR-associated protein Cas4 [Clostridia bacterium]
MDKFCIFAACLLAPIFIIRIIAQKNITKRHSNFEMKHFHVIYSDARPKKKQEDIEYSTTLKCEKLDIQGKPDFIFESNYSNQIVPVEIKSGCIKDENFPHEGDLMQLAAYFAITEEEYKIRPKFGRLIYKDYMFDIKNTKALRRELEIKINVMREMLNGKPIDNNYDYAKCRYCICRGTVCEFCEK